MDITRNNYDLRERLTPKRLTEIYPADTFNIRGPQFTMHTGAHIVFNHDGGFDTPGDIERYSPDYSTKMVYERFNYRPTRTHGIDQNPKTRTICYAEYNADTAEESSVWRSTNGVWWDRQFTVDAAGAATPEIRHFHCVAADPGNNDIWYLVSGDAEAESHMWKSTDDGLNWTKIHDGDLRVNTLCLQFDDDYVYWGSDTTNGGFYRMQKSNDVIEELIAPGVFSGRCYASIYTPHGWVLVYRRGAGGLDTENSYIYLVEHDTLTQHTLFSVGVDLTFGSRKASPMSGSFYIASSGWDYAPNSRMVRGRVVNVGGDYGIEITPIDGLARASTLGVPPDAMYFLEHKVENATYGIPATEEVYVTIGVGDILKSADGVNFYHAADILRG